MDIKEIALKVAMDTGLYLDGANQSEPFYVVKPEEIVEFAEALIESYKAELLKEVGEPGAWLFDTNVEALLPEEVEPVPFKEQPELYTPLFTPDQLAAAVLKATGPLEERIKWLQDFTNKDGDVIKILEDQLTKAEQLWQVAQGRCDALEEKLAAAQEENERPPAIDAYETYMADDEESDPVERLRFFLSLALKGQDWIDVEKFIDDVSNHIAKAEQLWQVAQGRCDALEEKLAKAEQRVAEWVSVETQLPGEQGFDSEEVLCFLNGHCSITDFECRQGGGWGIRLGYYDADISMFRTHGRPDNFVTHWMPLPKAPNGASS